MTLSISGLRKAYAAFELGPIDLAVDREVLAVLGPSGGGKSTLLQTVAGVVAPDAGRVSLAGRSLVGRPPEDRGTVMLFQDGALFPHLTARENIAYASAGPDRVAELAAALEIGDVLDRPAPKLSGGQRQRVALARALAADPAALLLDEPLANLDTPVKRRLRDEMRERLVATGVPVIYVTHDQREAAAVGDRVAVLADGQIHQIGAPRGVFERPATPFVASFTGAENVLRGTLRVDDGRPRFDWGPHSLPLDAESLVSNRSDGDTVWASLRPEHLSIDVDGTGKMGTVVPGRVVRRVYEGDRDAVTVRVDDADADLIVAGRSGGPDRPGEGDRVRVRIPREAVHVIGPVDAAASGEPWPLE